MNDVASLWEQPANRQRQPRRLKLENLWTSAGWRSNVTVEMTRAHTFRLVDDNQSAETQEVEYVRGLTLPGLANAHCHAFQRILAPWTQHATSNTDSFWTWRKSMYAAASHMRRDDLEAVTAKCYLDLLKGGYTGVAEFLYLHRLGALPDSAAPDADIAIAAAARRVGISLTLLPTLYQYSHFNRIPATAAQQLFVRSTHQFLDDWKELKQRYANNQLVTLGVAFHSLRAVDIETIEAVRNGLAIDDACRVCHMHVSEQHGEVTECEKHCGHRPVDLLLERGLPDSKWTLIHGTHASDAELEGLCHLGATLAVCPTTEADLGDGCLGAGPEFFYRGGQLAIGSDSNICCNAFQELRLFEWSQRLFRQRRNVLSMPDEPFVADALYRRTLASGWKSLGKPRPGNPDEWIDGFVTYGDEAGDWRGLPSEHYLSALVFAAGGIKAQQVITQAGWLVRDGVHRDEERIEREYRSALTRLRPQLVSRLQDTMNRENVAC